MPTSKYISCLNDIENTVSSMSNDDLEILANETEETLEALMAELKKRKNKKLHGDVDHLEEHLKNADISFKSLKEFISMALSEIKK